MVWTDIFIKRPVLSVVVSLLILLIGFRAATSLPIRQYPKLSNTVVNVTTVYPGASADLIQGFITTPIEQAVASAEGVDYMTSSSVQGTSTIQVYIKLNFDPNQALTEVLAKVNSVKYLIPKESNDPIVTKTTGQTTAVMYLGFSSEVLSGSAISDYLTRVVQPVLSTVDGVASADILGGQTFAMRLWLDPVRMAGRNVSADDVNAAIRTNNFQAAAGQAKGYFVVSNVTTNTDLKNLDQFKRMIVKSKDGGFKILSDNRSAGHDYFLSDRMEAGLVLTGTEVKAARGGQIQLKDAYGEVSGNEAMRAQWLTLAPFLGLFAIAALGLCAGQYVLIRRWVGQPLQVLTRSLERVADGDLSMPVQSGRRDDIGGLMHGVERMRLRFVEMLGSVRSAADAISNASSEIASGNQDLSRRTEEAAARLQQTASAMEQVHGNVRQTADATRTADGLACSASEAAERGGAAMRDVVQKMGSICTMSKRIAASYSLVERRLLPEALAQQ